MLRDGAVCRKGRLAGRDKKEPAAKSHRPDLRTGNSEGDETSQDPGRFFLGFGYARCLRLGCVSVSLGCSGQPDSFVSPRERGGLALAPAK